MREILFRAKRLDNGEWVEGSYVYTFNEDKVCPVVGVMKENYWIVEKDGNLVLVDKDTICQYTGLTDKNENKIWENDICDRKEKYPEIVKYHEGDFVLDYSYALGKEEGDSYCNLGFYVCERNSVKVIGNIFDNEDLLQ